VDFLELSDEVMDYSNYGEKSDRGSMSENCFAFETRTNDTLTMTSSKLRIPPTDLQLLNLNEELFSRNENTEFSVPGVVPLQFGDSRRSLIGQGNGNLSFTHLSN